MNFGGGFFGGGFPPEFGGGMGGGMGGRRGSGPVDNQKYYKFLEVQQSATEVEIKKAHRKMALKHHPDKGV